MAPASDEQYEKDRERLASFKATTRGGPLLPSTARTKPRETFGDIIARELDKRYREPSEEGPDPPRTTYKEKMVRAAIRQAAAGNLNALVELINRTEGKVPERVQADIQHSYKVVPWDDEDAPGIVYRENTNRTDRPDSGKALPPPDATPRLSPEKYRAKKRQDDIWETNGTSPVTATDLEPAPPSPDDGS